MHWSTGPHAKEIGARLGAIRRAVRGNRWSTVADACVDCGTTKTRHVGAGRCSPCYQRYRYRNDPEIKRKKMVRYFRNHDAEIDARRRWREANPDYFKKPQLIQRTIERQQRAYFGGLRPSVIERDGGMCRDCGTVGSKKNRIGVHHVDHNKKRNVMSNLITLCARCHARRHELGVKIRRWSKRTS